jgi:hypothetical protein
MIIVNQAQAQKTGGDKIIVQVTKDGKIISDTTFLLKEGQDPEAVKRVIGHVLEGDINVISGKEGHQKMVWITSGDEENIWHAEEIDVDLDTVMEHEGKVMVHKGNHPGEIHKEVIVKHGPEGKESEETIVVGKVDAIEISEGDEEGSKVIVITEKGDKESDVHQKTIKVIVEGNDDVEILNDEDLELIKEDSSDNVDVYVIKKDDGTQVVRKVKKVEVRVEEENPDNDKAEEPVRELAPKPDKKKK